MQMFATPFWVTQDLGGTAADYAWLNALRWGGTCLAILPLGLLAERMGARRCILWTLSISGVLLIAVARADFVLACLLFPIIGAFISSSFVNANTLVQEVSEVRRAAANSVYRATGTGAGILAPLVATAVAAGAGPWWAVLALSGACMLGAALAVAPYPPADNPTPNSLAAVWKKLGEGLRNRRLRHYLVVDQLAQLGLAPIGIFAALRLTGELGVTESLWGIATAVSGILSLGVVVVSARAIRTWGLRLNSGATWIAAGLGSIGIGILEIGWLALLVWVVGSMIGAAHAVNFSLWLSEVGGISPTTFTLHKLASSATFAVGLALLGALEHALGMASLLVAGGLLALLAAALILRFPQPDG